MDAKIVKVTTKKSLITLERERERERWVQVTLGVTLQKLHIF